MPGITSSTVVILSKGCPIDNWRPKMIKKKRNRKFFINKYSSLKINKAGTKMFLPGEEINKNQ
jgi:hypothetical protein